MIFAFSGPLGKPLGNLLGRLGGFWSRLEAFLGVLERDLGDSRPTWTVMGPPGTLMSRFGSRLGPSGAPPEAPGFPWGVGAPVLGPRACPLGMDIYIYIYIYVYVCMYV